MKFCKKSDCQSQVFGGGYCSRHQYLRKKSDEQRTYSKEAKQFKKEGNGCEVKLKGCVGVVSDVHHMKGRGKNLNKKETWLRCCRTCHDYLEAHPAFAKEKGFSASRLKKDEQSTETRTERRKER